MKKVVQSADVDIAMRSLDSQSERQVHACFAYLGRWDEDPAVRKNSHPLDDVPGVFVIRTTTEIRIFFRIDGDTITILDIAKKSALISSGQN